MPHAGQLLLGGPNLGRPDRSNKRCKVLPSRNRHIGVMLAGSQPLLSAPGGWIPKPMAMTGCSRCSSTVEAPVVPLNRSCGAMRLKAARTCLATSCRSSRDPEKSSTPQFAAASSQASNRGESRNARPKWCCSWFWSSHCDTAHSCCCSGFGSAVPCKCPSMALLASKKFSCAESFCLLPPLYHPPKPNRDAHRY